MDSAYTKMLNEILDSVGKGDHIRPGQIPDIDLYMDQVTHFMDEHLKSTKRHEDDKILTKTMINNYAKNKLLPAPDKKRYSREHMLLLIFIYYFKDFLQLTDIQKILGPVIDRFFKKDASPSIEEIYSEIFEQNRKRQDALTDEVMESFETASSSFSDCPEEDRDTLQLFSFICLLSYEIYFKKQVLERMLDQCDALKAEPEGKNKDR